jgi:uncharacterized protein (TIGR02001 family)
MINKYAMIVGGILLCGSSSLLAEISANATLTTDYVWRGISQSSEEFAIQGGFDWTVSESFSAGVWASNVDFVDGNGPDDGVDLELDLYFDYTVFSDDDISVSLGAIRYIYPGSATGIEYDWNEINSKISFGDWSTSINYSNDILASDSTGIYLDLGRSWSFDELTVSAAFGYYKLDDDAFGEDGYNTLSIGVEKSFEKVAVSLNLFLNDSSSEDLFGNWGEDRLVLSISSSF